MLFALGTIVFLPGAIFVLIGGLMSGPLWGTLLNLAERRSGRRRHSLSDASLQLTG